MKRIVNTVLPTQISKMSNLPPRKVSSSTSKQTSKQESSPLQILLQMGFPRHRALKALAATGNRSVQLASDWLLTHVNDTFIDTDTPREYILYACPKGTLHTQLHNFWQKSKDICGWNGVHNFPPHVTLVSFFKAQDESSIEIAKAVKHAVENANEPPMSPMKLEPYISQNFMGLFVSEEHTNYLKKIALQYVKEVSALLGVSVDTYEHLDALGTCFPWCTVPQEKPIKTISLEPHVKSLHITLAYHFDISQFEPLKELVDSMGALESSEWELRLYSRDPRFADHQVFKVTESYAPKEADELELVVGDYIYINGKDLESTADGWVQGTSWLTGVTGYLPAVFTSRTAESDAWTLHRAMALRKTSSDKSESDSTDCESLKYPHEDADKLAEEKSDETYSEWQKYWKGVMTDGQTGGMLDVTQGSKIDWESGSNNSVNVDCDGGKSNTCSGDTNGTDGDDGKRRWYFALRHGERVDLTYGQWVPHAFTDAGDYVRKDLNMPLTLTPRAGAPDSYQRDTPLTRIGRYQAFLVGEGLRLAGVRVRHVYASCALRCVETAHSFLEGLQADPSVKVRVEPGLFEYKAWHLSKGALALGPFMTVSELHAAGLNVDLDYKPYVELSLTETETMEEYYQRGERVMQSAVRDTESEGGNVIFVGHATTLDTMVSTLKRYAAPNDQHPPYQLFKNLLRVPYCALGAMRDRPWQVVSPPCPPSINSSSGRFDWKLLLDL